MRCFCSAELQTRRFPWGELPACHASGYPTVTAYATAGLCLLLAGIVLAGPITADELTTQDFDRHIAPLIAQRCLTCHSGDEPKGKLDLSSREKAMVGGESGIAIVPGKPEQSLLWENIDADQMPPKKPLSAIEKARLKTWIAGG
ncbi:MAG: c-type cytochrome domain-containing protein, partial [Planctomycetaceae bacterium]